jgi:hypothetical protein
MGRLLGMLGGALLYFSVATLVAQGVLLGYLFGTGQLTLEQIQTAMHPQQVAEEALEEAETVAEEEMSWKNEQASLEQIAMARAIKMRDLELREQALRHAQAALEELRYRIGEEKQEFDRTRVAFRTELKKYQEESQSTGEQNVRSIVETIKPKQAKQQILAMIERGNMAQVVELMEQMPTTRQAKIAAEFKSPDEAEKLGEILRMMRQGLPESELVNATEQELDQAREEAP